MKLDMDLVRTILKDIEDNCPPTGGMQREIAADGYDKDTIFAHTELLIEAGLVKGAVAKGSGMNRSQVKGLTMDGYTFIAEANNDTMWAKAKAALLSKGVPITLSLVQAWLKAETAKLIGH